MAHRAIGVLAELDPHAALARLRELDGTEDPRALRLDGSMLRRLARAEGVLSDADLAGFFEDGSFDLRSSAAEILSERGDPSLVDRLIAEQSEILAEGDESARAEAARRLSQLNSPAATEVLTSMLEDESEEVRLAALQSLARPSPDEDGESVVETIDRLRPLLEDDSELVRRTATRILEGMERRVQLRQARLEAMEGARRR